MKIAVIGPQNTGKSTFISDIIASLPHFSTPKQTYRDIVRKHNLPINQKTSEESQRLIRDFLFQQIQSEQKQHVIFDRCVIDNLIYSTAAPQDASISTSFIQETEKFMYESLQHLNVLVYIPTSISIKLVNDNTRDTDTHYIDRINTLFIETLLDIKGMARIPIWVITGTRERRIKRFQEYLQNYLSNSSDE